MEYKKYLEDLNYAKEAFDRAQRILLIAEKRMHRKAKPDPEKLRVATAEDLKFNALLWYRHPYDGDHTPMIVEEFDSRGWFQANGCNYELAPAIFVLDM